MHFTDSPLSISKMLFLLACLCSSAYGVTPELRTYRITCDSASFAYIIGNPWSSRSVSCLLMADDGIPRAAGLRVRGESSRNYPKKSFNVNFEPNARLNDRDQLNLISEWTDPTFCREYFTYELFAKAGLLAPRGWFTKLYVNGRYMGLYFDVEQIDEQFIKARELDRDAPIFKADANGTMLLSGEVEAGLWKRETGDLTDFSQLIKFIDWLGKASDEIFFEGLGRRFDLDALARAIAINSLVGNTSTYYHNYYLIKFGGEEGRWHYVPWDVDQSFYYRSSYSDPPYCRSGHQTLGTNELIRRCWLDPKMKALIIANATGIIDSLFGDDYYEPLTDSLATLLRSAVDDDTMKQYSLNDFLVTLRQIPTEVRGRGEKLKALLVRSPQPFDLVTPTISPTGIRFDWGSAMGEDSAELSYTLQISKERLFSSPELTVRDLHEQTYHLEYSPSGDYFWRVYASTEDGAWLTTLHQFSSFTIDEFDQHAVALPEVVTGQLRLSPVQGVYVARKSLVVEAGGKLIIEPGVKMQFADSARLIVRGELEAVAIGGDSIRIGPLDPALGWGAIEVEGNAMVLFAGCIISGGSSNNQWATIQLRNSGNLYLTHCKMIVPEGTAIGTYSDRLEDDLACLEIGSSEIISNIAIFSRSTNISLKNSSFSGGRGGARIIGDNKNRVRVRGCKFYGLNWGLLTESMIEYEVSGCQFEDMTGIAVLTASSTGQSSIKNSIFMNCEEAIQSQGENCFIWNCDFLDGGSAVSSVMLASVVIRNSVFWKNRRNVWNGVEGTSNVEYSLSDLPLEGFHNLLDSPSFEKPWDGDFTPEPDSPLIDAGLSDGAPEIDYYGRPRLNTPGQRNNGGGRFRYFDIGAVEYPVGERTPPPIAKGLIEAFPNPLNDRAMVRFEVEVAGRTKIGLFDVTGRKVGEKDYQLLAAGLYRLNLSELTNSSDLPAGIYFCRLDQPTGVSMLKMALVR